jgi:hypothetical protein
MCGGNLLCRRPWRIRKLEAILCYTSGQTNQTGGRREPAGRDAARRWAGASATDGFMRGLGCGPEIRQLGY